MLIDDVGQTYRGFFDKEILKKLIVIKIQNVSDYLYQGTPQEVWDVFEDFPNVAPPFPLFWMEFKGPQWINSESVKVEKDHRSEVGIFFEAQLIENLPTPAQFMNRNESWKWIVNASIFLKSNDRPKGMASLVFIIDKDGKIVKANPDGNWCVCSFYIDIKKYPSEIIQKMIGELTGLLFSPFLALSFMHCKNISVNKAEPWSNEIQNNRIKKGLLPHFSFYTLQIEPIKKILQSIRENENPVTTQKALHICRGHFKSFVDHGLFGKYFGQYWWPMHTRGNPVVGEVIKDYEVSKTKS